MKQKEQNEEHFKVKEVINKVLLVLCFFSVLMLIVALSGLYNKYGRAVLALRDRAVSMVAASDEELFRASETTLVYAADGTLLSKVKGEKDVYYLEYDYIPKCAIEAMIVTEDKNFYTHPGYDIKANIRAIYSYFKNDKQIYQGASTITQQLARNCYLTMEVTFERKITEIFIAAELEKKYTKNQILEFYFNNIYFANGCYGIQAAAQYYFAESAVALDLSEIVFLCSIPNNPTKYNPLTNYDNTIERRDRILLQMYENGIIGTDDYKAAVNETITLCLTESETRNYEETYTYYCSIIALMRQKGFELRNTFEDDTDREEYEDEYYDIYYSIQKSLFTGGYRIYTSIEPTVQGMLQEAVDEQLAEYTEVNDEGTYCLQGSGVCIDNETGRVIAIVGGRQQEGSGYTLNRAYQCYRQPGSAIKPLLIYTPLFERGLSPEDIVNDEYFEGGPRNAGNAYEGEITVRRAIEVSKNTIAWKLFEELTPAVGLSYLLNMGFKEIVSTDYYPAASLGGFTYGVSAVEMTSGFAAIENDGVWREPTCITRITDSEGNTVVGDNIIAKTIYEQNASRTMTNVLKGVMTVGTGRRLALDGMISAGKTGTATNLRDGWFVGYTTYYTAGIWVGYDLPRTMEGLAGSTYPGYIWKQFMNELHEGLESKDFEAYEDDVLVEETPEKVYNAFGEEIDPETGLPVGMMLNEYGQLVPIPGTETLENGDDENADNENDDDADVLPNGDEDNENTDDSDVLPNGDEDEGGDVLPNGD